MAKDRRVLHPFGRWICGAKSPAQAELERGTLGILICFVVLSERFCMAKDPLHSSRSLRSRPGCPESVATHQNRTPSA
jgi:hypothetical protein